MATTPPVLGDQGYIDFGRAFRFVPDDPDWIKKVLIGGLFMLLNVFLIPVFFLLGYGMRLIRRAARGESQPLPHWDDLGAMFTDGLRGVGLLLAHVLLLGLIPAALGCLLALVGGGMSQVLRSSRGGSDAVGGLVAVGLMGLYALVLILMLVLFVYLPAALTRLAILERFGAGFEFRENIDFIKRNLGNYALALVLSLVVGFIAQFGIILCCIGFFPVSFWANCVYHWALGEVARRDPVLSQAAAVIRA